MPSWSRWSRTLSGAVVAALLSTACGGGSSGAGSSGGGGTSGAAAPSGTFTIAVTPPRAQGPAGYTALAGKVFDGPYPEATRWTTLATAGGCTLQKPVVPSCVTSCEAGVCVADGTCQAYPTGKSVGPLTIAGLGPTSFTVTPVAASYSLPGAVELPYPPFAEGAAVTLAAAGLDEVPAFTVASKGIAPLTLASDTFAIAKGATAGAFAALTLGWTPPAQAGVGRIHVLVDISHHGGIKGKIECDVADTGSLTIPADLVTRLVALGVAQYPAVELTRRARGTTAVSGGTVALNVDSTVAAAITIEGVTCTAPADCGSGSCDTSLGLCR